MVSDLNKNIGGSTDLAEKRHGGDGVKKEFSCLPQTMILIKVKGLIQNDLISRLKMRYTICNIYY